MNIYLCVNYAGAIVDLNLPPTDVNTSSSSKFMLIVARDFALFRFPTHSFIIVLIEHCDYDDSIWPIIINWQIIRDTMQLLLSVAHNLEFQ